MNEELSIKLANLEGQLQVMASSMQRIELTLEKVVSMDRTLAEQVVRLDNQQSKIREIEHDIKSCSQAHRLSGELLDRKVMEVAKEFHAFSSRTEGMMLTLKIFSGFASVIILSVCGWVYNRVETNTTVNLDQGHRIVSVERDISDIRDTLKKIDKKLDKIK